MLEFPHDLSAKAIYQDGVRIAQDLDPDQYSSLQQLQALAEQHGYPCNTWDCPTPDQVLFIFGVVARFHDDRLKASCNWLDLAIQEEKERNIHL